MKKILSIIVLALVFFAVTSCRDAETTETPVEVEVVDSTAVDTTIVPEEIVVDTVSVAEEPVQ